MIIEIQTKLQLLIFTTKGKYEPCARKFVHTVHSAPVLGTVHPAHSALCTAFLDF